MPCFHPLDAFHCRDLVLHSTSVSFKDITSSKVACVPVKLPCGQCVGCRLERSRQWAVRCMHEAQMFERNCFITLTYDPKSLPTVPGTDVPTLRLDDFQKFMKRLRKRFSGVDVVRGAEHSTHCDVSWPIRFFHCGEYGEKKAVLTIMLVCLILIFRINIIGVYLLRATGFIDLRPWKISGPMVIVKLALLRFNLRPMWLAIL